MDIPVIPGINMPLEPRQIINSPFGIGLASMIGRFTPYWLGYRIAFFAANRISARKDWKLVRAARCNQWVIHGEQLNGHALDQVVAENKRLNAARENLKAQKAELETQIMLSKQLGFIDDGISIAIQSNIQEINKMITGLIKCL